MIKKIEKFTELYKVPWNVFHSLCQINMPLRRTEKLSNYFISTAYLSHGEFSISYTEMQEGKRVAANQKRVFFNNTLPKILQGMRAG